MKSYIRYILGTIAVMTGLFFCSVTFQPMLGVISHINDPAYECPKVFTTASRVFSVMVGIIAYLANFALPEGKHKGPESAE